MVPLIWISQVVLVSVAANSATELLPERYLKPQDFNHHPFTDVGIPASLKKASSNPYAILARKKAREGGEFPPENVIIYPTPPPSVLSRKQIETNEISKYRDIYVNVPKNYAFSYIVKDKYSGDDFSHSQAHNGKATRGQYRVKLPDGRIQIVSYMADHKGYRADVQYELDVGPKNIHKPLTHSEQNIPEVPAKLPEILPTTYKKYQTGFAPKHIPPIEGKPQIGVVYTVAPSYNTQGGHIPSSTVATPVEYTAANTPLKLLVTSTVAPPLYYQPQHSSNYVSKTPANYLQGQYVSSTSSAQYLSQQYVSSTPLYPIENAAATVVPSTYQQKQYQSYHHISSTASPQQAVIVTPRPIYNQAVEKGELHQPTELLYRFV